MHAAKHGHLPTLRLLLEAKSTHFTAVRVVELDAQNKCARHHCVPAPSSSCTVALQGRLDCNNAGGAGGIRGCGPDARRNWGQRRHCQCVSAPSHCTPSCLLNPRASRSCSEGITATDIAFVAKNSPMMLVLPPGSKGKGDSMQAQATVRSGGNAFPIHFSYVSDQVAAAQLRVCQYSHCLQRSEPMAAIGDGGAKSIAGQSVEQGSKVEQNQQAGVKKSCCTIL